MTTAKPNHAQVIEEAFKDWPLEARATIWMVTDPDHYPSTASGEALDKWGLLITGKVRRHEETDEEYRARVMAAMVPK